MSKNLILTSIFQDVYVAMTLTGQGVVLWEIKAIVDPHRTLGVVISPSPSVVIPPSPSPSMASVIQFAIFRDTHDCIPDNVRS